MANGAPIPCDLDGFLQPWIIVGAVAIVAWLVIVGLTGWLALRRGRDDGLWAVIALFTGPVALVILFLLPRRAPTPEPASEPPSNDARGGWSDTVR